MSTETRPPKTDTLVLDAGPLIARKPLKGLANRIVTTPQVVAELKDPRVRLYWEQLPLLEGINIEIRSPGVLAMAKVTALTKKFGDYATLSQPDLAIIAITLELDEEAKAAYQKATGVVKSSDVLPTGQHPTSVQEEPTQAVVESPSQVPDTVSEAFQDADEQPNEVSPNALEELSDQLKQATLSADYPSKSKELHDVTSYPASATEVADDAQTEAQTEVSMDPPNSHPISLYEDPSSDDDGDGEWITPTNVKQHQERANGTSVVADKSGVNETLPVACMTADFAMQNSLLRMGLNLVSFEGLRVKTVKTSVLRCHACFKICKDQTKKFCPSCGGPTLRRTTVSLKAGNGEAEAQLQVHLKRNFQWKLRGTQADLPPPRMGRARGGGEAAIILREDQKEWQRGVWSEATRQRKEEKRVMKAMVEKEKRGDGVWNDPDWVPQLLVGGTNGGGRMPIIGLPKGPPKPRKR